MKLTRNQIIILVLISSLALFCRLYNLEKTYSFGWDQERDAWLMWQMIHNHKPTLIGPRVVSDTGFFLGPAWYYLLLPFYFFFQLDPVAGGYFTAFFGVLTTISLFLIFNKTLGSKEAILAALAWAVYPDRTAWNPILIPLVTLLYLCLLIDFKDKTIPVLAVLFALGIQIHMQAIFLIVPIGLAIIFKHKKIARLPTKQLLIGAAIILISFVPLIVFDLRHEFINLKTAANFFRTAQSPGHHSLWQVSYLTSSFAKYFNFVSWFMPFNLRLTGAVVVALSFIGISTSKLRKNSKMMVISAIILPPAVFSFYKGSLSEYYFMICLVPILIGLTSLGSKLIKRSAGGKLVVISWLALLVYTNLAAVLKMENGTSLYYKKQAVSYLTKQELDPVFNVSYSTAVGGDAGFRYLFNYFGRQPQDAPEGHLWTIAIPPAAEQANKIITFGDIGIIRR